MEITLDILSGHELDLYNQTIALQGTIEEKALQISELGIGSKYEQVHRSYLQLAISANSLEIKMESLKRLAFLNWIVQVEPSIYTGVKDLNRDAMFDSFSMVNELLSHNLLDKEFKWMLSYYSSWEWAIISIASNKLDDLTNWVNSVDTSKLHLPTYAIRKATMINRGQMGIYYLSLGFDIS